MVLSVYIEYARSNFVVYLYDILFISLFFIVIIYAFIVQNVVYMQKIQ